MSIGFKRSERIADQLKRELAEILLRRVKDPRLGSLTITSVKVTDDLRYARVFYVLSGSEEFKEQVSEGLLSAKGFMRHEIGQALRLKYVPELDFCYDSSFDYAERIESILHQLRNDEPD